MIIKDLFKKFAYSKDEREFIDESLKQFKNKIKNNKIKGEGFEDIHSVQGFGNIGTGSFNLFYEKNINKDLQNNKAKLIEYRKMYEMPEIGDVVENAAMEATQKDIDGNIINLDLIDDSLAKNENISKNLQEEFNKLFNNRIEINKHIRDWYISILRDGKIYLENIINKSRPSMGILGLKKLPCETMDYDIDYNDGKITNFYQFLVENAKKPTTPEEIENNDKVVTFYPSQITFIDSGIYGINKKDVLGYLHKCRQPFNQLRLLETSVVIYRLIRAPERLVFKIDTGNMPKDKAMRFVEKVKNQFSKKQIFDHETGALTNDVDVTSILENYFLAQCLRMDTKISLMNGKEKSLKEIINDFNNGIENEVYSVDQSTGKIIRGKIEWAGITRKNADLVRVWLDNDEYIDCTPDHKFVLRDGSEKEAQYLKENDSLMPLYKKYNHKVAKIEILPFKEDTGCLTIKDPGDNHNFALTSGVFVKNSSDGRGSDISSIGGDPSGFSELSDIKYFQKKLYRALKYPASRVTSMNENRQNEIVFAGNQGEIERDEIFWAKFLESYQTRICEKLADLFMLHLTFIGLAKEYNLDKTSFQLKMTPPNNYIEKINQSILQQRFDNYQAMANNEEFPKSYLMRKYLNFDDEKLEELKKGWDEDKKFGLKEEDDSGF